MPALTDEDKVIRNDVGKRIAAAIEDLSAPEAEKVSYDNTESGMTADNAQDAIDELKSDIDSVELADLDDVNLTSPQDEDELHYDSATSKWKNIAKKIYEKSASGSLVSFNDGGDNIPLKSLIANITAVQAGSGTPSPSNVRAISGWSGANVTACKKNLCSIPPYTQWQSAGSYGVVRNIIPNTKVKMILLDNDTSVSLSGIWFGFIDSSFTSGTLSKYNWVIVNGSGNSGATNIAYYESDFICTGIGLYPNTVENYNKIFSRYNIMIIDYSDTATTYEPYNGIQITLPFGQTVYGGTLDVLNGVLTVTHKEQNLGELTWSYLGTTDENKRFLSTVVPNIKIPPNDNTAADLICEKYATLGYNQAFSTNLSIGVYSNGNIIIKDLSYNDATTFQNSLNNVKAVFALATPVTYQLTPAQVATLLGLNNIFADTGDISLSYFTQNANAINDIAESNTRTALNTDVPKTDLTDIFVTGTKNNTGATIAAGTYFYVNGQLALCKSAISANADLTLNTNYELVTAGALNKLMSDVVGIAPVGYNANTDRNTESNRQTAMRYLRTNCFSKGGASSSVRYSGGYYFTYLFGGVTSYGYDTFVEFAQSLTSGEKIIYWGYNVSTDTFTKLFSIS